MKHGHLVRAWRRVLDLDGNGRLSRNEFFIAARDCGYQGNLKKLWDEMDEDGSGHIQLEELQAGQFDDVADPTPPQIESRRTQHAKHIAERSILPREEPHPFHLSPRDFDADSRDLKNRISFCQPLWIYDLKHGLKNLPAIFSAPES